MVPLCCSKVDIYFDTMRPRRRRHAALKLSTCSKRDCLGILVDKLREENCLQKVTSLSTLWTPDKERGSDLQQLELWSLFENVQTLELRPHSKIRCKIREQLRNGPGGEILIPNPLTSVVTLIWKFPNTMHSTNWGRHVRALLAPAPIRSPTFPNVTTLKFWNVNRSTNIFPTLISRYRTSFPGIKSLSILNNRENENEFLWNNQLPHNQLTRLEFNLLKDKSRDWEIVLDNCALTLEHLDIRGVRNAGPEQKTTSFTLPILPRLKSLKISRSPQHWRGVNPCLCSHSERELLYPELHLKFKTAARDSSLDYPTQFPSLLRLEVGNETGSQLGDKIPSVGEDDFETCLPFLYGSFLPPPSSTRRPCTSLRLLIVPTLPESSKKWRVQLCPDCSTPQFSRSRISGWEKEAELFARVVETFPNLDNIGRYRHRDGEQEENVEQLREMNHKKMKKWLQIGEDLGLLEVQ